MNVVKVTLPDGLEVQLSSRELNLLRSAILKMQAADVTFEVNQLLNEIDFKLFRIQQRTKELEVSNG